MPLLRYIRSFSRIQSQFSSPSASASESHWGTGDENDHLYAVNEAFSSQDSLSLIEQGASQSTTDEAVPQWDLERGNAYQEMSTKAKLDNGEMRTLKRRRTIDPASHRPRSLSFASTSLPPSTQVARPAGPALTAVYRLTSSPPTNSVNTSSFVYAPAPPSTSELLANTSTCGMPDKVYRDPHYSRENDAPEKPREYAGLLYHLKGGDGLGVLQDWDVTLDTSKVPHERLKFSAEGAKSANISGWEYASCPPSVRESKRWLNSDAAKNATEDKRPTRRSQVGHLVLSKLYVLTQTHRLRARLRPISTG